MTLLKTKFHKPEYSGEKQFSRPAAKSFIRNPTSVTVISGPAGFGKTSMISQIIKETESNPVFLSLDTFDNNPIRFWTYFAECIRERYPRLGNGFLALLNSSPIPEWETCIITLVNDLYELSQTLLIILDDLHMVEEKNIYNGLDFLIDNLPDNVQLLLSGREDPPLALGRLRVSGRLNEIRQTDLRFTEEETAAYLKKMIGLELTCDLLNSLYLKTEGWPAGLQLTLLALKTQNNPETFIRSFSGNHKFIFDYLIEEVFKKLSPETESFLKESSVFSEFTSEMCNLQTGKSDSDTIIKKLFKTNLFLIPLDNEQKWFRYHHLFREFLLSRLFSNLSLQERDEKYAKAFSILKGQDRNEEAFYLGFKGRFYVECKELLLKLLPGLLHEGRNTYINFILDQFPNEIVQTDPNLFAVHSWHKCLKMEPKELTFTGVKNALLEGVLSLCKGYSVFYKEGNLEETLSYCKKALELIPEKFSEYRNSCKFIAGLALRLGGDLIEAEKYFLFDLKPDRFQRRYRSAILQELNRIELMMDRGQLEKADAHIEDIFRQLDKINGKADISYTGYLWVYKAVIAMETNRFDDAFRFSAKGVSLCRGTNVEEIIVLAMIQKGSIEFAAEKYEQSTKTFEMVSERVSSDSSWLNSRAQAWLSRIQIRQNIIPREWANSFSKQHDTEGGSMPQLFPEYLFYSEYLLFTGKKDASLRLLERMSEGCEESGRIMQLSQCLVRIALIKYSEGRKPEALNIIKRVFSLNSGELQINLYIEPGGNCLQLLSAANEKKILPDYLKKFAADNREKKKKIKVEIYDFTETFNDREIDILGMMEKGFSNQEISDTIFLSINTVRWYARQIYNKLDVKRRGEAVVRAKELAII